MRSSRSRALALRVLALLPFALFACGLESISTGGKSGAADAGASPARDAAVDAPALEGAGCGREAESGLTLCAVTSMCPNVVVDVESFPHCGFRINGSAVDLVCGCTGAICPMGIFTTCAQAAQLLTSQTEQAVCMQVAEGRCVAGAASNGSTSSSGGTCDRQCIAECGGGAGCASLCGC